MEITVATDYIGSTGNPDRPLRFLSEAGFTHLHWCHQWCTDFMYGPAEWAAYREMLKKYGLRLMDIHGSQGQEKCWNATEEYMRKAGVELVTNRIEMLSEMDADPRGVLMMHMPRYATTDNDETRQERRKSYEALVKSVEELIPVLEKHNRKIAMENLWNDTWELLDEVLAQFPAKYIGICYDSGHANSNVAKRLEYMAERKDRLEALHLHDNDGNGDLHQPPFYNTVDWTRLAKVIGTSKSYAGKPVSFELSMTNTPFYDSERSQNRLPQTDEAVRAFCTDAYERCLKFANMVEEVRSVQSTQA